jgi:hypothetical protein
MQRWRHAGLGPRCALVAGVLLGVASLVMYQSAYAAVPPPYPGPPGLPGIPPGPTLGCNNPDTSNVTWVCGFNPLTTITFKVDGRNAGTSEAGSSGCVLVVVTFLAGEVQVDGNAPVPVKPGTNYLIVEGEKTSSAGNQLVGLRLPFRTPTGTGTLCVPTTTTSSTFVVPPKHPTTFPRETTTHPFSPTTLAKVLETPLVISPNKVIIESSLLAGVLAAALSAGALGAMWGGTGRDVPPDAAAPPAAAGEPPDEPEAPPSPPEPPRTPPPDPPAAPLVPPPSPVPQSAPPSKSAPPSTGTRPIVPNAFIRPSADPSRGVT